MTDIFENQPSPDSSNYASSSGFSVDDKEIGYRAATSKHIYLLANKSALHFFSIKIDLNYARMVRVLRTYLITFRHCLSKFLP